MQNEAKYSAFVKIKYKDSCKYKFKSSLNYIARPYHGERLSSRPGWAKEQDPVMERDRGRQKGYRRNFPGRGRKRGGESGRKRGRGRKLFINS